MYDAATAPSQRGGPTRGATPWRPDKKHGRRILSPPIKKGAKPLKNTRGRPRAEVDLEQLERLCELQCTQAEVASFFRVSVSTVKRPAAAPELRGIIDRGAALGRVSLRRQQFKLLQEGSDTMAIWLGKQYLSQRDHLYRSSPPQACGFQLAPDRAPHGVRSSDGISGLPGSYRSAPASPKPQGGEATSRH
jgi:hypothetical protein